jgi:hypothetical protein
VDKKLSFFAKEKIECPVCETGFHREEAYTGGGRQNAGSLTEELHRTYIASANYGEVFPLIYPVTVCPSCYYASFQQDFLPGPPKGLEALKADIEGRIESVQSVFAGVDYNGPRGLLEGAASYYLALRCYDSFGKEAAPTVKQAICSVRAAWLLGYLHAKFPNDNYDYLQGLFYAKARFLYGLSLEKDTKGQEALSAAKNLGPDTDKNFGYEGVLYMNAILELKYGPKDDPEARQKKLGEAKRVIAKMFGLGKHSKNKPGPLLEQARSLYDRINDELHTGPDDDEES